MTLPESKSQQIQFKDSAFTLLAQKTFPLEGKYSTLSEVKEKFINMFKYLQGSVS